MMRKPPFLLRYGAWPSISATRHILLDITSTILLVLLRFRRVFAEQTLQRREQPVNIGVRKLRVHGLFVKYDSYHTAREANLLSKASPWLWIVVKKAMRSESREVLDLTHCTRLFFAAFLHECDTSVDLIT